MNSVGSTIALCGRCRRQILPKAMRCNLGRDVLRTAARGMTTEPDPLAERKRAQRDRKRAKKAASLRSVIRAQGIAGAVKLFLETRNAAFAPISEECPDCQALQRRTA